MGISSGDFGPLFARKRSLKEIIGHELKPPDVEWDHSLFDDVRRVLGPAIREDRQDEEGRKGIKDVDLTWLIRKGFLHPIHLWFDLLEEHRPGQLSFHLGNPSIPD